MTTTAPAINLLDPAFYVDPWDAYRWLRANDPVHWDPVQRIWGISRYADVVAIEKDARRYTSWNGSRPKIDQREDSSMINKDDPEHQDQRRLVARRFTPRAVKQLEDYFRGIVTELIDAVAAKGSAEAVMDLAAPLPAIVIGEKLGFDRSQWDKCREWSEVTMHHAGQTAPDGGDPERSPESEQAIGEFAMAMMELIAARRAEPRDDLVSVWLQATEPHGRPWTEAEIISEAILLLDGGAETTRTVIGAMIYELARNPAQRQLLLDGADMTVAVEEMIRWVTPILNMRRTATEDHELHGRQITAGDELLLMYSSANRDEDVFDRPDELDLTRQHNNHVAFGFGTHFCLGSSLARIEIKVMFEELLRRIPDWRIAPGTEPKIIPATFTRAYDAVHIEFTPA